MIGRWFAVGAALGFTVLSAQSGVAQVRVATTTWEPTGVAQSSPKAGETSRLVSLALRDASVAQALAEIQRRSGVSIAGGDAVLNEAKRVTVKIVQLSPLDAVNLVLQKTSLAASQSSSGTIVVTKRSHDTRQGTGVLIGKIIHATTKQPISGATISVDGSDQKVVTRADGTFRLTLGAGDRVVRIRAVGFVRQEKEVTISNDAEVAIEVLLEPSASVLNEVIVTGTVVATERKAIPNPITVITAEDIEKRGITRIEQFFRGEVPGVFAMEPGAERYSAQSVGAMAKTDIYVRGSSTLGGAANPMKVYIDGIEMLDPSYLGTIDPVSIERIEIITGPQAATIYGSGAMGGVMQIFTKKGTGSSTPSIIASMKYGMIESNLSSGRAPSHAHNLTISGGSGVEFSYSGNASYNSTGQWMPHLFNRRYGASVGVTHTRGNITTTGTVGLTAGKNGTSNSIGRLALGAVTDNEFGIVDSYTNALNSGSVGTSMSTNASLNVDYRVTPSWQHHATVGRSGALLKMLPEAPRMKVPSDTLFRYRNSNNTSFTGSYNTSYIVPVMGVFSQILTIGFNGSSGESMLTEGCAETSETPTYIDCGGAVFNFDVNGKRIQQTRNSRRWGGFGQWRLGVVDKLFLTLGLRGEQNRLYGTDHKIDWTPTNGIAYTQELGIVTVKVLGSYGKSTRDPSEDDRKEIVINSAVYDPASFVSQFGNPDLTPEYSSGPQGGVEVYLGSLASVTVNHYRQKVEDLIERIVVDSFPTFYFPYGEVVMFKQGQMRNNATIEQYGWEATGSVNIGSVSAQGTYSWNESRIIKREGRPNINAVFKGIPTHTANVRITYASGGTSVSLISNIVGSYVSKVANDGPGAMEYTYSRFMWYSPSRNARVYRDWRRPQSIVSDVAMRHQFTPWITGTLHIANVGNSYATDEVKYTPRIGRQTLIGASLRFPR